MRKREKGWYIIDRAHNNICLRGPYEHIETAGAVRTEMERSWDDGDKYNPRPDTRNLWVVDNNSLDNIEQPTTNARRAASGPEETP